LCRTDSSTRMKFHPSLKTPPDKGHHNEKSALTLLVTRILTNHTNDAAATDQLALVANLLNGSSDFHDLLLSKRLFSGLYKSNDSIKLGNPPD
jgi:hypothetical protein